MLLVTVAAEKLLMEDCHIKVQEFNQTYLIQLLLR